MFKTREEIKKEIEILLKEDPQLTGVYQALIKAVEEGFTRVLKSTTVAAIALGFKKTIHVQGLVLLDMYLYSLEEAAKHDEKGGRL
jgi:response regulator of citrate/malate metabolism